MEITESEGTENLMKVPGKALAKELIRCGAVKKTAERLMEGLDATTP